MDTEAKKKSVSISEHHKKYKFNPNGKRIIENWCPYAQHLIRQEREKKKKIVQVSIATVNDAQVFEEALERLREIREEQRRTRSTYTCCAVNPCRKVVKKPTRVLTLRRARSMESSRSIKKFKSGKSSRAASRSRSRSCSKTRKSKSKLSVVDSKEAEKNDVKNVRKIKIHYPEIKRRTWIPPYMLPRPKPQKPVVIIPPFKTRPWNFCKEIEKTPVKKEKPKIEYPPLKLRQISPLKEIPEKPKLKKLSKLFYPLPTNTLEKSWNSFRSIDKNLFILNGSISQFSKKFNYRSNGKQSAFIAAVALVHSQLVPMKLWTSDDLDEIVNFGDINFRKQVKCSVATTSIRPPEMKFKIYTRRTKTSTDIGIETRRGCFDSSSSDEILKSLDEILTEFNTAIFTYCGQSFAIWKDENSFYIFNSMACDEAGNLVEKHVGVCCVLRSSESLKPILDHIGNCHENQISKHYEIFSFKINSKICIDDGGKVEFHEKVDLEPVEEPIDSHENEHKSPDSPAKFLDTIFESQPEPQFAEHFHTPESSRKVQGYLECDDFLTDSSADKQRAQFTACAAIAMTKLSKASNWRSSKMKEIFRLGTKMFNEISADVKAPIVTEIEPIIELKNQKYQIKTQNLVYGRLHPRCGQDSMSLVQGLRKMFRENDCVILKGFETVAIWRESGKYFLFDPFSCDGLRRSSDPHANSCLTFFANLDDLSSHYIENVDRNFRNSVFKLAKVEICEHKEISPNWQNFKSIGVDKWILSGNFSESSANFKEENRNFQSTAMSATAIAKTRELGIQSWTSNVIDDVVTIGDEFYSGTISDLKKTEKFVDNKLTISELGKVLRLDKIVVELSCEEFVIGGSFDDIEMSLRDALEKFFDDDDAGVLTTCGMSYAIWKIGGAFYFFDSHDRDDRGRNWKTFNATSTCVQTGKACVVRFLRLDDLATHVIANAEVNDSTAFSIGRVEAKIRNDDSPCLFNYQKIDANSAILPSLNKFHEDLENTHPSSISKTVCNLISCVCFAQILNPLHWKPEDVNGVIRLGTLLLCQIVNFDLENFNETFTNISVAGHKFNLELLTENSGTFGEKFFKRRLTDERLIDQEVLQEKEEVESPRKSATSEQGKSVQISLTQASVVSSGMAIDVPELATLKDQLANFNDNYALLTSNSMHLAIFKFGRLFFVFDPNSSGSDGKFTKSRVQQAFRKILKSERENVGVKFSPQRPSTDSNRSDEVMYGRPIDLVEVNYKPSLGHITSKIDDDRDDTTFDDFPSKGGAYIAWFRSHELLHEHIMKKIPSRFHHDQFTLKYFQVTKSIDDDGDNHLAPWRNFQAISTDHWILRANISQSDTQFCQLNRDNQDIPNCILALTFTQLCQMAEWNSTLIDIVLKLGDRLYRKSIAKHTIEPGRKLTLKEIDFPVFMRPFIVNVSDELVRRDFMVKASDKSPLESFKSLIGEFDGQAIVTAKNYSVAVWRDETVYYMFDGHDLGPNGYRNFIGTAAVQRFEDHRQLVDAFFRNVRQLEGFNEYQVTKISIVKTHYQDDEADKSPCGDSRDLLAHSLFKNAGKFQIVSANIKQATNVDHSMEICYAIAAICISQTLNPEFYTREIIDMIMNLGNDLADECGNLCLADFDLNMQRPCHDEINWNFELNNRHFSVQLDIFKRGVISILPCPSPQFRKTFEEFFDYFSVGILITDSFSAAVWNDAGIHFVFYARNVNEDGNFSSFGCEVLSVVRNLFDKMIDGANDSPSLLAFHSVQDLFDNISDNLDKSLKCQKFEIRSCSVKISDVKDSCDQDDDEDVDNVEETIPAISADVLRGSEMPRERMIDEDYRKLTRAIKKKKSTCSGFVSFKNYGVLAGKLSAISKCFDELTRENHSGAIALVAIAEARISSPNCWTGEMIDRIVVTGSQLYSKSQSAQSDACGAISLDNIIKSITFNDFEFNFKIKSILKIAPDNFSFEKLNQTLGELLNCFSEGFVRLDRHYWTVFQRENCFFLFDPRGMEFTTKTAKHRAVLLKFSTIDQLTRQMIQIITASSIESETEIGTVVCSCRRRKDHRETDENC